MLRTTHDSAYSEVDEENMHTVSGELTLVERLARAVSSIKGRHLDYAFLASELTHALPFDVLGIVLLRHDGQAVRVASCVRDEASPYTEGLPRWHVHNHQHPLVGSMFERMIGNPALQIGEYPDGLDGLPSRCGDVLANFHHLHSTCLVPLQVESRILGTLELGSIAPHTYSDKGTQRLVNAVAQVLATAIERAQLGGNTQIQDRQRQALKNVSTALASKVDVNVVLDHITTGISNALNVASLLVTFDANEQHLQLVAKARVEIANLSILTDDKDNFDQTIVGCVIHQHRPFLSDDIECDTRFPASRRLYTQLHMRSVLCYPLIADTKVYGVLLLCTPESGGFTPLKVDIVGLFANQAAIAIREGMLMEAASQRQHFQQAIEQLEREVHEPLSDEEELRLFKQVRVEVKQTFGTNLSSLLKLIGNNLLTKDERTNQIVVGNELPHRETVEQVKTVLVSADMLSSLSSLLVRQEQASHGVRDAWFVSDLVSQCVYVNPLAESLCNVRLTDIEQQEVTLEMVFTPLFPRVRNVEEVRSYLQAFIRDDLPEQTVRCIVAQEVLSLHPLVAQQFQEETGVLTRQRVENSTDKYYQLLRHPLHNQQGRLIAYALQARDVTTQVLDEINKSTLLSAVSHHLRTPLTTIKAAVTGLLQDDVPWSVQMQQEMLEDIDQETDHLTVLVNGLVELSRIEMGALVLEKTWCDIEEVIYAARDNVLQAIGTRPIHIQMAEKLPLIYVDYVQIERVMYNLFENAVWHSTSSAPIVVVVDVIAEDIHLAQVRVKVIYQGEHIPVHEQAAIFHSFDRLSGSGNGLALAISKGIIEAHRGEIWIESVVDSESCFVFTIPIYTSSTTQ